MRVGIFGMSKERQTPYFVLHKEKLQKNLSSLQNLEALENVHILHTLKSFNQDSVLPIISSKLSGMSITTKNELRMAQEASAKYIHLYAPAFKENELLSMLSNVQSVSFNSLGQWERFKNLNGSASKGLRINPKLSLSIPSHCNPNLERSRLGIDSLEFLEAYQNDKESFKDLEGLHFHALFQSSVEDLILLLDYILKHYKEILPKLLWLNLGGGHRFTELDYDVNTFVNQVVNFQELFPNITFYFEPGEAVTKGCGEFVCTVLDIVNVSGQKVVILDTSVETHLLDVAIVQMSLKVRDTQKESTPYCYELTGNSCLQGDIIGKYFFNRELHIGNSVIFEDMIPYTMVKMTEFNGMEKAKFYIE